MKLINTEYLSDNELLKIMGTSKDPIVVSLCTAVITIRKEDMDVIVFEETRPVWDDKLAWMHRQEITEGSLYDHIRSGLKCGDWEYRICIHEYLNTFEPSPKEEEK